MTAPVEQQIDEALKHHSAGRFAEAEEIYRRVLTQRPGLPAAMHLLGVLQSQLGKKDVAVEMIGKAIAAAPNVPEFHSNLALVFIEQGRPDQAIASCRRALQLDPQRADALEHLGT